MVAHLRSYLPNEKAVLNVLQYNQHQLVDIIHGQMDQHSVEPDATEFEAHVSKGFETIKPGSFTTAAGEGARPFRQPVEDKLFIRTLLFSGFSKCLFDVQKFESDSERRLAVILEDDKSVLRWFKPTKGQIRIFEDEPYLPDFVVETATTKFLIEPKRASEIDDPAVQAKARAAVVWCSHASAHAREHGAKPWAYLLVPHDRARDGATLAGLAASCQIRERRHLEITP